MQSVMSISNDDNHYTTGTFIKTEKINNYLNLARELKKLWNMKIKVTSIVVGVFRTVSNSMGKGLEE